MKKSYYINRAVYGATALVTGLLRKPSGSPLSSAAEKLIAILRKELQTI